MPAIRAFIWTWGCILLIVLAGCNNPPPVQPVKITPLTLPPSTATSKATTAADWTTYHYNNSRNGYIAAVPDPARLTSLWNRQLDGAVYAEPLVVNGHVLVATENDTLYSLDAHSGQVQWHTSLGTPVPLSDLPCGNIDPLGITGTPVYDAQTGLVFAVAEVKGPGHILFGIDVRTGQIKVRRSADPAGIDPQSHQQRAALALYAGRVYVAYGGLDGDCGNYHGWVVASRTNGQGPLLSYQVPTTRQGGIWAASGPAVDSAGHLYVAVGNGAAVQGTWDHSDSVLRLSATLQLADGFAPRNWQSENAADADLGSMGPLLLPNGMIFADGKGGQGYLLRANALGGIGGQAQAISLCTAFGGAAALGPSVFVPCTDGLRQVQVGPGTSLKPGWHAPSQVTGSPVVGGHTVYSLDPQGMLYALDATTGNVRATLSVGATSRFATPTLSNRDIFIGTMTGIVAVAIA
ncbi:MAG: PQQ-binding-like beta-propeller repeat protein [Ktedonobacteraceae bacterium]|nr:PQQ-binding-like beta-propeller repeat protein [Ktedonobacteraceae bacterium]